MISGRKAATKTSGDQRPFLHGSDVSKKKQVSIKVTAVREAPEEFNAPIIIEFEPIGVRDSNNEEITAWAANKTAVKTIIAVCFPDETDPDLEQLVGTTLVLDVGSANNPQTKRTVPSLYVSATDNGPVNARRGKRR